MIKKIVALTVSLLLFINYLSFADISLAPPLVLSTGKDKAPNRGDVVRVNMAIGMYFGEVDRYLCLSIADGETDITTLKKAFSRFEHRGKRHDETASEPAIVSYHKKAELIRENLFAIPLSIQGARGYYLLLNTRRSRTRTFQKSVCTNEQLHGFKTAIDMGNGTSRDMLPALSNRDMAAIAVTLKPDLDDTKTLREYSDKVRTEIAATRAIEETSNINELKRLTHRFRSERNFDLLRDVLKRLAELDPENGQLDYVRELFTLSGPEMREFGHDIVRPGNDTTSAIPQRTVYDISLDRASANPGEDRLAKMVEDRYTEELVRRIAMDIYGIAAGSPGTGDRKEIKEIRAFVRARAKKIKSISSAQRNSVFASWAEIMHCIASCILFETPDIDRFSIKKLNSHENNENNTGLIFSQGATFGRRINMDGDPVYKPGLGVYLRDIANSGIKIAVVAPTDKQKREVEKFNEGLGEENKITVVDSAFEARGRLSTGRGIGRAAYFKIEGEEELIGAINIDVTTLIDSLLEALGHVFQLLPNDIEMRRKAAINLARQA